MSDHLFDNTIVDRLIESADPDFLNVAVDRKLDSIFDLEDAMKVQTCGDRITNIGKTCRTTMRLIPACSFVPCKSSTISSGRSPPTTGTIAA